MRAAVYLWLFLAALLLAAAGIWTLGHRAPTGGAESVETGIARALAAGHHVVFPGDLNENAFRWALAEQIPAAPAVAVFGSSHGLRIGTGTLGREGLVNFSISGATLADHLITTRLLTQRQLAPQVGLVVIDPWLFDLDTDFGTWRERAGELTIIENEIGALSQPPLAPIVSPRVAQSPRASGFTSYSLDPIVARLNESLRHATESIVLSDSTDVSATLILADGSLLPPPDKRVVSAEESRFIALRQIASKGDRRRYGTFTRIDPALWQQFENWLRFWQQRGTRIVLVLPPYHPALYGDIHSQPDNQLAAIEARVRSLARREKLELVGSYDPSRAGVGAADFMDGDHLHEAGLRRLLAPLSTR